MQLDQWSRPKRNRLPVLSETDGRYDLVGQGKKHNMGILMAQCKGSGFRGGVCFVGLILGGIGVWLAGESPAGLSLEGRVSFPTTYEAALETLAIQGQLPLVAAVPKEPVSWPAEGTKDELTLRELLDLTARSSGGAWQETDGCLIVQDQQALAAEEASLPRNLLDARNFGAFLKGLTGPQQDDLFEDGTLPLMQLRPPQGQQLFALYSTLHNLSDQERESWMASGELLLRFHPRLLVSGGGSSKVVLLTEKPLPQPGAVQK